MPPDNPALVEVQLRALARNGWDVDLAEISTSVGAAVSVPQPDGRTSAFVMAGSDGRAVGRSLQWAAARSAHHTIILASDGAADLARRAGLLSDGEPSVEVAQVDGAQVQPARAQRAAEPPPLPDSHWSLAGIMSEAGARPVDDHGRLVAEVAGLEVARVVEPADGSEPTIEVGVGQADRELNQLVHHAETDPGAALRRVIAAVAELRTRASHHPLARLARERWLRAVLLDQPGLVGADELSPLVPLRPRPTLLATEPTAAAGLTDNGRPVVVVATVGVDLDLVPEAADYRERHDPSAELVIVVPPRDVQHNSILLDRLPAAGVVSIDPPWE